MARFAHYAALRPLTLATLALLAAGRGYAQVPVFTPPFTDVHSIATAATAVPVEESFNVAKAGNYQITLTDLGAQQTPAAPMKSLKLALTQGTQLIGTPLTSAGVLPFNAPAAGAYVIHVVGTPGNPGSGPIGLQVGTAADPASLYQFSDMLALPDSALPNGEAVINDTFTLRAASGSYTLTLKDYGVPQTLSLATLILIAQGAAQPVQILPDPVTQATQASVTLTQGVTYRLIAAGQAGSSGAGLLGASVTQGGTVIRGDVVPVGTTQLVGTAVLPPGQHSAELTDLSYPSALSQLSGVVTLSGQVEATLTPGAVQSFSAVAGTYQVFVGAVPAAAAPSAGSYAVVVQPSGGAPELSVARTATAPGSAAQAYSFDTAIGGAGAYSVNLANFAFPVALTSLQLAAVQNGALLGAPLNGAGALAINAVSGPISLLVLAQADPAQGGVFDVNLTQKGNANLLFDVTQGVVGNTLTFLARKVALSSAGNFLVSLNDVGFPANFSNVALLISQGGNTIATITDGGQYALAGQPGDYFMSLIAQPANTDLAGTYALSVQAAPPPALTLTASAASVSSGTTVTLTWTSSNATTCGASNGWSGNQGLSGKTVTAPLTQTTTYTLTCTGAGGAETAKSVTVMVSGPVGGGGGGGLDPIWLVLLLAALSRVSAKRNTPRA